MILDDRDCPECGTRRVDVLPSRGDCQTCLKARMAALRWFATSVPAVGRHLVHLRTHTVVPMAPSAFVPSSADPSVSRLHPWGHAMTVPLAAMHERYPASDDRHGWHCPCVACRIDRGED